MIIERLSYDEVTDRYGVDIFAANQTGQDFSRASAKVRAKSDVGARGIQEFFGVDQCQVNRRSRST